MKLEVGQFVRTKDGYISQYKYYDTTNAYMEKLLCIPLSNGTFANIEDIVKASYNIIDILKEGDYVNGSKVLGFENEYIEEDGKYVPFGVITENCYLDNNKSWIIEKEIKSVVTKEQMEQTKYKVGE